MRGGLPIGLKILILWRIMPWLATLFGLKYMLVCGRIITRLTAVVARCLEHMELNIVVLQTF